MTQSDVITELCTSYGIKQESTASFGELFYCRSLRSTRQRFAAVIGADTEQRATLRRALELAGSGSYAGSLEALSKGQYTAYQHRLSPDTAQALFRAKAFSATKLENLNMCRFKYFCENGLRIREKSRKNLSSMEIGNIIHYVLQKVLEKYCGSMDVFITLPRPKLAAEARFYLKEYREAALGGDFAKNLRFDYLYKNLTTGAVDILLLLQAEFAARDYRPKFFELRIGGDEASSTSKAGSGSRLSIDDILEAVLSDTKDNSDMPAPKTAVPEPEVDDEADSMDNNKVPKENSPGSDRETISTVPLRVKIRDDLSVDITGIIDRADTFTDANGNEYIRVVDYKTGKREFSLVNVYYGISTQMLLYLIAVCDSNKGLHAGGVSYLPARVTGASNKASAAFSLLSSDHIQSGMFVSNDSTDREAMKFANAMAALSGDKPKKFLPKEENLLTEQEYEQLRLDCLGQTREVVGKLYDGDVEAVPTVYREKSTEKKPCDYCRFNKICGKNKNVEVHAVPKEETGEEAETDGDKMDK